MGLDRLHIGRFARLLHQTGPAKLEDMLTPMLNFEMLKSDPPNSSITSLLYTREQGLFVARVELLGHVCDDAAECPGVSLGGVHLSEQHSQSLTGHDLDPV